MDKPGFGPVSRRTLLKMSLNSFLMGLFSLVQREGWVRAMEKKPIQPNGGDMKLPKPAMDGGISLEQTIQRRRTHRKFGTKPLTSGQLAQLLWAAQGITEEYGYKRSAPSAGAMYPMDIYAVVGEKSVDRIEAGVYHYLPGKHTLSQVSSGDFRNNLARASLHQSWMARAPVNLVITAEYDRINVKYGNRGERYAMIEAGHMGQNIFLQAESLLLRAGIVGAFHDQDVTRTLNIPSAHEPLLIMPVGHGP